MSDNSIAPFNDGSAIAEARAVAASIANGRYRTTQTRMVPGRAAPVTEDFTVHDPKKYHPPLPQPTTDVTAGIKQRVPTHPTRAGAEARWGTGLCDECYTRVDKVCGLCDSLIPKRQLRWGSAMCDTCYDLCAKVCEGCKRTIPPPQLRWGSGLRSFWAAAATPSSPRCSRLSRAPGPASKS